MLRLDDIPSSSGCLHSASASRVRILRLATLSVGLASPFCLYVTPHYSIYIRRHYSVSTSRPIILFTSCVTILSVRHAPVFCLYVTPHYSVCTSRDRHPHNDSITQRQLLLSCCRIHGNLIKETSLCENKLDGFSGKCQSRRGKSRCLLSILVLSCAEKMAIFQTSVVPPLIL